VKRWLLKQEPSGYAWSDLVRDGATEWNGVHNPLALRYLREMSPRDLALFYHTGTERAAVGIAAVTSEPRPDPSDPRGSWTVDVRPVRPLRRPISLAELRTDRRLAGFELFRFSRLSVVPVSAAQWKRVLDHEVVRDADPGARRRAS
jgi:predicted RNA-binding protein with PUA-like domain